MLSLTTAPSWGRCYQAYCRDEDARANNGEWGNRIYTQVSFISKLSTLGTPVIKKGMGSSLVA